MLQKYCLYKVIRSYAENKIIFKKKQFIVRTLCFLFCMLKSHNGIVEVCTLNALHNANSPVGSNLSFLRSKYRINFQSYYSLAHCIKVATAVEQIDIQSWPVWRDRVRR